MPGFAVFDADQLVRFGITDDFFRFTVPLDFIASSVGDITQVSEGRNAVAKLEIEHRMLTGIYAVEEIPHKSLARVFAGRAFALRRDVCLLRFSDQLPTGIIEDDIPFGAMPFNAPGAGVEAVVEASPVFPDPLAVGEVKNGHLGIRRLG